MSPIQAMQLLLVGLCATLIAVGLTVSALNVLVTFLQRHTLAE